MHKSGKKKNPPQDDKVNCRLQQAVANHKSPNSPLAELSSKPHLSQGGRGLLCSPYSEGRPKADILLAGGTTPQ